MLNKVCANTYSKFRCLDTVFVCRGLNKYLSCDYSKRHNISTYCNKTQRDVILNKSIPGVAAIRPYLHSHINTTKSFLNRGHHRQFSTILHPSKLLQSFLDVNHCLSSFYSAFSCSELKTVNDVAKYITQEAQSILVMSGAGISTASGIPDFRSPGTGLYHNLKKYNLPYPEAIFDIQYFMMDPRPFVSLAQELYPGVKYSPNKAHYFLRLLQEKGKLHKLYTQNIDGLERMSGIMPDLLVECHGSFSSASCTLCGAAHDPVGVKEAILTGPGAAPVCHLNGCKGLVKPDIVFFGENLPEEFWKFHQDLHAVDLLLILGTSLEVYPFAGISTAARSVTPRVLLNNEVAGDLGTRPRDCVLLGDLVESVSELAEACGWQQELLELMAEQH